MPALPELVDGLPNLCGAEAIVDAAPRPPSVRPPGSVEFAGMRSAAATALHMHQPLVPAGGADLRTARIIGNLQHMFEHPWIGDYDQAPVMHRCYKRLGDIVPALIEEGARPRVMLDYSGTLLYGLRQMGLDDVMAALMRLTRDPACQAAVEWLGSAWGHPVAPSTPVHDYRLHVKAWRHHFAAAFGLEALGRVRGFSPAEMALPNHPDVAWAFVRTLKDCGYEWVLVQEDTVERPGGGRLRQPHVPHRLTCRNSGGDEARIIAIVKTVGSDARLVGRMEHYAAAERLPPQALADGTRIPPLVTQIADGENEVAMMHEFPGRYRQAVRRASGSDTPLVNVSEYLDGLFASGVDERSLPEAQPAGQHRIWDRFTPGDGPERLEAVLGALQRDDPGLRLEGGSWTNDISWVRGYEPLIGAIEQVSRLFLERVLEPGVCTGESRFRTALFHLLACETSCYRYWGQGIWVDYGLELCRRTSELVSREFRPRGEGERI